MLFNSLNFLIFFLVVYGLYGLLSHRKQNGLLLLSSYFFYGCWDYRFLTLIIVSTLVDYWAGLTIFQSNRPWRRKAALIISLVTNLGILGFFKYFNFFVSSAEDILSWLGLAAEPWRLNIILPVGISFYTFQTMSYTIDIYREKMSPTRNLLNFATFVAFFPQLVAGPIERASRLLPQIEAKRTITREKVEGGLWLIMWGLFKKAVIADNLAQIVDALFASTEPYSAFAVIVGLYAFAFQIYCDFSGYSDMARGLARCMGIELMVNFNNPYFAVNPSDFWKRWHISLSSWLRDYLYISLGGNRKGTLKTYRNLGLTMLLGGLWHGAAWTFVVWGAYQGLLLIVHRIAVSVCPSNSHADRSHFIWLKRVGMFHAICLGWLFFRAETMGQAGRMLNGLLFNWSYQPIAGNGLIALIVLCAPLWCVQFVQLKTRILEAPRYLSLVPRTLLYAIMGFMFVTLGHTGGQAFIYFQF
jgi:D-alanyl-lipoteichoic acid acyltransferase DltB (MBOAT superfamily)